MKFSEIKSVHHPGQDPSMTGDRIEDDFLEYGEQLELSLPG